MTANELVKFLEGYYCKYESDTRRKAVLIHLEDIEEKYGQRALKILRYEIVKRYSSQYRHTPDIAVIEDVMRNYDKEQYQYPGGQPIKIPVRGFIMSETEKRFHEEQRRKKIEGGKKNDEEDK